MTVAKEVFADEGAAARACAARMERILEERLAETERVAIAVSGGNSPQAMFEALRASRIDWTRVHWFWVDERCVAADDPGSNYGMTRAAILDPAKIPEANIHRIQGERGPQLAAARYADELRAFFGLGEGQFPEFDVLHLGMGEEGHTASLFPGEPMIEDRTDLTAAVSAPKPPHERATLLPTGDPGGAARSIFSGGRGKSLGGGEGIWNRVRSSALAGADRDARGAGRVLVSGPGGGAAPAIALGRRSSPRPRPIGN